MGSGMIRVLAGSAKGRKLYGPDGLDFRPATGRVKEYIFNFITLRITGYNFLDLFAGSGSLGIEALSRGAEHGIFIDSSNTSLQLLKKNIGRCRFTEKAEILKGSVFSRLDAFGEKDEKFDIIFADPPFKNNYREQIAKSVSKNKLLSPDGFLIIEHEKHDTDSMDHDLYLFKEKKIGHCQISIYKEDR